MLATLHDKKYNFVHNFELTLIFNFQEKTPWLLTPFKFYVHSCMCRVGNQILKVRNQLLVIKLKMWFLFVHLNMTLNHSSTSNHSHTSKATCAQKSASHTESCAILSSLPCFFGLERTKTNKNMSKYPCEQSRLCLKWT